MMDGVILRSEQSTTNRQCRGSESKLHTKNIHPNK